MSKIIDTNKFRVENSTKVDLDDISLINMILTISFPIYILMCIAAFNQLYFIAFSLFIYSLTFKIQKQIIKQHIKDEAIKELNLISNDDLNSSYSIHLGTIIKNHCKDKKILNFWNAIKKSFGLKYESKDTIESQLFSSSKYNAITPALMNDEMLREHTILMATTGGGKTEMLLNSYIESTIARGGGVFAVFGKSDNQILQKIQSILAKYNRLQDLLVYDLAVDKNGKTNSNTINFFEIGNINNIVTTLVNISNFDKDTWGNDAKSYLSSLLKVLLNLKDANFFINVNKIDEIYESDNKFEDYKKNIKKLDFYSFKKILSDNELLFKLLIIFDYFYENHKSELNEILYKKFQTIIESEEKNNVSLSYLSNDEKNQFHLELKSLLVSQSSVENWKKLKTLFDTGVEFDDKIIKGLEAISLNYPTKNGAFYKLQESISNMKELTQFFETFASILNNQSDDIPILDAIDSNKIVIFNIPGQNDKDAPILSQMVISLLKSLLERRGKDFKSDVTSLVILDEINSWLKTKGDKSYNLGDIQSVVRSLNMALVLSFQSSLKETLGHVDASQVFATTNTIISLKLTDNDLIETLNKNVEKVKKLELEENIHSEYKYNKHYNQNNDEIKYNKTEEDYFKPHILKSIKKGEGFIIRNGHVHKFMSNYINQTPMYKTEKDEIYLNRYISLEDLKKEIKC